MGLIVSMSASAGFATRYEQIPSWDGTLIAAVVITPTEQGPGPFPLIVMPSAWGTPNLIYVGRGTVLASQGYVVVSYSSRGLYDSQGLADLVGPASVEDVSSVIDWAMAHTPSNPAAIGASGISYGAGTALLAAARDPRIKAVASLSTWGDLAGSVHANQTLSSQVLTALMLAGIPTARSDADAAELRDTVLSGRYDQAAAVMERLSPNRSPINEAAAINANRTAIFLANSFNDSAFIPGQLVDFYNRLNGPRQLMLSQGDHGTAEAPGALGFPNEVYTAVGRWFDHHLKGQANGVDTELPVRTQSMSGQWRHYPDWAAVQRGAVTYALPHPGGLLPTGRLSSSPGTGWGYSITTGLPTQADSGTILVTGLLASLQIPTTTAIPLVARNAGARQLGIPIELLDRSALGRRLPQRVRGRGRRVSTGCSQPSGSWIFDPHNGDIRQRDAECRPVRIRMRSMAAEAFPHVLKARVVPTARRSSTLLPRRAICVTTRHLPAWADFNEGEVYYGFPDLGARGFEIASDAHGAPTDPDAGDRVPSTAAWDDVRNFMRRRFPGLITAPCE